MPNIYLMPTTGDGTGGSHGNPFRAKYADDLKAQGVGFAQHRYGNEGAWFVYVPAGTPAALHATIQADATCFTFPDDLSITVGAQSGQVTNLIENFNIPANWIQSADTWRSIARVVAFLVFLFEQFGPLAVSTFFGSANATGGQITLATTWNNGANRLTAAWRTKLQALAASYTPPLDTTGVTGTTTVRQLLKGLADQVSPNLTIQFGDDVL